MNAVLPYILNILLILIEVFVLYQLGYCFFQRKCSTYIMFVSFLLMWIMHVLVVLLCGGYTVLKYLLLIILESVWIWVLFKPHILKCLTLSITCLSIMLVCDSVFLMGFSIVFSHNQTGYTQNIYAYYLFAYAAKIVELLLILVVRLLLKSRSTFSATTWHDWLRVITFPLMTAIVVFALMQIYESYPNAAPSLLFCSAVLICADLLAIMLLNFMDEQQNRLHDYAILKHDIKLEQDNVTAWMNAYSNQRKQTHEYQHQLEVVRGLAQQGDRNDKLIQYVSQLLQTDMSDSLFVKTGRLVVDVILNQKSAIAQSKGITLKVQLDDLSEFALPDDGLVVVLSNLIDNAIEACDKNTSPDHKVITLKMQANPEANFLYIENHSEQPVVIFNNRIITTKQDISAHGYGLKNIEAILSQYGGDYALDYAADTMLFCFSAQIVPQ